MTKNQTIDKIPILESPESNPKNMMLVYVSIHPMMIKLLSCGLDILMYRWFLYLMLNPRKTDAMIMPQTAKDAKMA